VSNGGGSVFVRGVKAFARLWSFAAVLVFVVSALCLPSQAQAQGITVSPPGVPQVSPGVSISQTFTASGRTAPYTFTISGGTLPPSLTLSPSGVLTGTAPTALGNYDFTVRATDVNGFTGGRPYRLTVRIPIIALSPQTLPYGEVGQAYDARFSTQGGGAAPFTYTVDSGVLPPGLSLNGTNGQLSGTATTAGIYSFTIKATDRDGYSGVRSYSVEINSINVTVVTGVLNQATAYQPFTAHFSASGVAPRTFTIDGGTSAPGLTLSAGGVLSGVPTTVGFYQFVVRATDANGLTGSQIFSHHVVAPTIRVAPSFFPQAVPGVPVSEQVTVTGGVGPHTLSISSGALPTGLTLSPSGLLSGVANTPGTYPFTIRATDANGFTGETSYSYVVGQPVISMTPTLSNGQVGSFYGETIYGTGTNLPFSYAVSVGALPPGLTLSSAGVVSGTPTADGTFNFTVQATDSQGYQGVQAYSMVITPEIITVSPAVLPRGIVGSAYSQPLTASGGVAPYTFTATSVLPSGIALRSDGTLTGTPQAPGAYNFTVLVTDANGATALKVFSLTVIEVVVTPVTLPPGMAGTAYSQSLSAAGGSGPYTFALAGGALPAGLNLGSDGTLSGTPTAAGLSNFVVRATDANGVSGTRSYMLSMNAPAVAPAMVQFDPTTVHQPFNWTFTANGGVGPYVYTIESGGLPPGINLSGAGVLSGSPTAVGHFGFTVRATDANGFFGAHNYSLQVKAPTIAAAPSSLPNGQAGVAYSETLGAAGGVGPYTFENIGSLPTGMTLSSAGLLAGTSTQAGDFFILVRARDANGYDGVLTYHVTLAPAAALVLSPAALPDGAGGVAYNQAFTATGGVGPHAFLMTGALPRGLTFSTAGVLSGVPLDTGDYPVTVRVTDAQGTAISRSYTLRIAAVNLVVSGPLPTGMAGVPYSQTLTVAGGTAPYSFIQLPAATDPQGLRINAAGVVTWAAPAPGDYTIHYAVMDAFGFQTGGRTIGLSILAPTVTVTGPAAGALPAATAGAAYSQTFTAAGGTGPHTFALAGGALPAGLTLSSAGVLSGAPTQAGAFDFAVRAIDASTGPGAPFSSAAANYTLTVNAPTLTLTPATLVAGVTGQAYSQSFTASGGAAPYTYAVASGALPAGLALTAEGVLSGTPTIAGAADITVRATDANGFTVTAPYAVVINPSAVVAPPVTLEILAGETATADLTAGAAGGPFTGAALVSLSPVNAGSAVISSPSAGRYVLTFTSAAAFSGRATATYTLSNSSGASAPGTVIFVVEARPDPALDPEVTGLIAAQGETARRFASSQIDNIGNRMAGLRDGGASGGASLQLGFSGGSQAFDYGLDPSLRRLDRSDSELRDSLADRIAANAGLGALSLHGGSQGGQASSGPLGVWAAGVVDFGRHDQRSGQEGAKFTTSGLTAGVDYRINARTWLGLGLGYGRDVTRIGEDGSRSESNAYSAALYGGVRPSPTSFLDGVVGYGVLDYEATRYVTATGDLAAGERDGDQWFWAVTGGWDLSQGEWRLSPYGRVALSRSVLEAYAETTGGLYALAYDEQELSTTTGSLGLRGHRDWLTDQGRLTTRFRLEYSHDFDSSDAAGLSYVDWIGGQTYQVAPRGYGQDRILIGAGLELLRRRGLRLGLDYEAQVGEDLLQHQVGVRLETPF
jgi:outer membrane autotransporter protein